MTNYLLDTHTFIWWDSQADKLPRRIFDICNEQNNQLFLSVISLWEIVIKVQIGKFVLRQPLKHIIQEHQQENNIQILPVSLPHVLELQLLPLHHRDPFDRLLIAQAKVENTTLLSKDSYFRMYDINVIW